MGFTGLILASLVGVGTTAFLAGWLLITRLSMDIPTLSVYRWREILFAALPFGISDLAGVFLRRFDTILISMIFSEAAVGWYNASWSLIMMILLLAQSLATAAYPSVTRACQADPGSAKALTQRLAKYLLMISLPIAMGGTILADRIILLLYREEFAPSIPVLRIALWALPSLYLLELLGRTAPALGLERRAAKINLSNAGITILLNLFLVPVRGVIGAAIALVIGRIIRVLQFWRLLGSAWVVDTWISILKIVLATGLMGFAVWYLKELNLILIIFLSANLYIFLIVISRTVSIRELSYILNSLRVRKPSSKF